MNKSQKVRASFDFANMIGSNEVSAYAWGLLCCASDQIGGRQKFCWEMGEDRLRGPGLRKDCFAIEKMREKVLRIFCTRPTYCGFIANLQIIRKLQITIIWKFGRGQKLGHFGHLEQRLGGEVERITIGSANLISTSTSKSANLAIVTRKFGLRGHSIMVCMYLPNRVHAP